MKKENRNAMLLLLGLVLGILLMTSVAAVFDSRPEPAGRETSGTVATVPSPSLTDSEPVEPDSEADSLPPETTADSTAPPASDTDSTSDSTADSSDDSTTEWLPIITDTVVSETYWWEVEESVEISFEEEPYEPYEPPLIYDVREVPANKGYFKTYTSYTALGKNTSQWKLIQCHEDAYTDPNGLRKVGNYYCVAMASFYTRTLGDLFEITTTSGTFRVIITDFKSDRHTNDDTHQYGTSNGCMVEFYVDIQKLPDLARKMGNISYVYPSFFGYITGVAYIGNIFSN